MANDHRNSLSFSTTDPYNHKTFRRAGICYLTGRLGREAHLPTSCSCYGSSPPIGNFIGIMDWIFWDFYRFWPSLICFWGQTYRGFEYISSKSVWWHPSQPPSRPLPLYLWVSSGQRAADSSTRLQKRTVFDCTTLFLRSNSQPPENTVILRWDFIKMAEPSAAQLH